MLKTLALAATMAALPLTAMAEVTGPTITGTRLDIVARGAVTRVPDVAVINAGVVTQSVDAKSAMSGNAAAMAGVLAALRKAGVAERDMMTATSGTRVTAPRATISSRVPVIVGPVTSAIAVNGKAAIVAASANVFNIVNLLLR